MDLTRLDRGLQIASASALALFVLLFFPWYGRTAEAFPELAFDVNITAWEAFGFIDIVLLAIAGLVVAIALLHASGRELNLPISPSVVVVILGVIAAVLIAYRLIEPPVDLERRYGIYLGLLAAIGIAVGGRLSMSARRESFADARDTVSEGVSETRRKAAETIGGDSGRSYEERSKEELYEEASRRGIEGRSEMTKEELVEALRRER